MPKATQGKTLFISIPKELKARVIKYSDETGIPMSKIIKFALIQYLDGGRNKADAGGQSEDFPQLLGGRE